MHRCLLKIPYLFKLRGRCGNCNFTTFGYALGILYGWYSCNNKHVAVQNQFCVAGVSLTTRLSSYTLRCLIYFLTDMDTYRIHLVDLYLPST
jgi:hypothetical protein